MSKVKNNKLKKRKHSQVCFLYSNTIVTIVTRSVDRIQPLVVGRQESGKMGEWGIQLKPQNSIPNTF